MGSDQMGVLCSVGYISIPVVLEWHDGSGDGAFKVSDERN